MYGYPGMKSDEDGKFSVEEKQEVPTAEKVLVVHTVFGVEHLEALGYHVVTDSDLMSGGEI